MVFKRENSVLARALYIHYPVCQHVCSYCDFNVYSKSTMSRGPTDFDQAWLKALERDLLFLTGGYRMELDSLYLGGGTPSLLTIESMSSLSDLIATYFDFSSDAEQTIECNPESFQRDQFEALRQLGWNRFSVGVQSFNQNQLKRLERLSTLDRISKVTGFLKDSGANFNLDLMMGLPDQKYEDFHSDLMRLTEIDPPHISVYVLGLAQDHKWLRSSKMKPLLPGEDLVAKFYERTHEFLVSKNYEHYEVSNFSKKGFQSRHNQTYWDPNRAFLAIGPGAHGYKIESEKRTRYEMIRDPQKWLEASEPTSWFEELSQDQQDLEQMYLMLRSGESLPESKWKPQLIDRLESEGYIERSQQEFRVRASRWVMLDSIVNALLSAR